MPGPKDKFRCPKLSVNVSSLIRLTLSLSILLIIGGIEPNPGPAGGRGTSTRAGSTRQSQRSSIPSSQSLLDADESGDIRVSRVSGHGDPQHDATSLTYLLTCMRTDMNKNMSEIKDNLQTLNTKVGTISDTCEFLKAENQTLKQQNETLYTKVNDLESQIDNIEGQSRRNNLIFHGLKGNANESWEASETKIRDFISDDLDLPSGESVDLERVHRLRTPGNKNDGPIIVKFTKFKDRETVIRSARDKLDCRSQFRIAEDFTPRVRQARRALGEHLVRARSNGQRARMTYDKLIVENIVYRYDDVAKKTIRVGNASNRFNPLLRPDNPQPEARHGPDGPNIAADGVSDTGGGASGDEF